MSNRRPLPIAAAALMPLLALPVAARQAKPAPAAGPPELAWPLACQPGADCWVQNYFDEDPGPGARDYRCGAMTYDGHDGTDIRLPTLAAMRRGVPVLAAGPGVVRATRDGVVDASIRDAANPHNPQEACGNAVVVANPGGWQTIYCHMRKGSVRVRSGDVLKTGQPIGLVGLSGDTEFPHLHIGVQRGGRRIDPFAPDASGRCGGVTGRGLWSASVAARLAYRSPSVINAGFAGGPVTQGAIDDAETSAVGPHVPLVAYVRSIGLEAGDVQRLRLVGPAGELAMSEAPPLDRAKAVYMSFAGKKPPGGAWAKGVYQAQYSVTRGGKVVLTHSWSTRF